MIGEIIFNNAARYELHLIPLATDYPIGSAWVENIYQAFKARLMEEFSVSGNTWDGSKIFDGKLNENNQAAD